MRICKEHWEALRAAIENKGMSHLVKSGQEIFDSAKNELTGEGPTTFDPLFMANNMIVGNAIKSGGLYLLGETEDGSNDGHYCPLCEAKYHGSKSEQPVDNLDEDWIEGCTEAILRDAIEKRIIIPN
jgi:hypothetical protein